ncbi:transcriptional regulator family: Fungal Specific TF, partial [Penicillium macrosclerotiorum]|uniref:transcriptional regulator family: Fungal Specific TF n=1 Tax=Penicillium macrosclerotiorum TaxID=303699 RepID=UPI002546BBC7
ATTTSSPASGSHSLDVDYIPKRRKLDNVVYQNDTPMSPHSSCAVVTPDESTHHAEHAKVIIQSELDGNERMNQERQSILKSALDFVNSMTHGQASNLSENDISVDFPQDHCSEIIESIAPAPELFYMLMREPTVTSGSPHYIQWPDHISEKTLRMIVSLFLRSKDQNQLFYQYCICVYVKAIFRLYHMPRGYRDPMMNAQFLQSKRRYEACALHALRNLNFLNSPSLPFIQSLISAAFLMQYQGNMSQAWVYTSYASRLITVLNYHEIRAPNRHSDFDEEINSCLYWCFYLDRTLSSLLHRPLSLPELHISPRDLVSEEDKPLPHMPLIRILVDLAQVQGDLLNLKNLKDTRELLSRHSKLQDRMSAIHSYLQSSRSAAPDLISADWIGMEFCHFAILVDILRSRLRYAFSPLTHRECVSYSRKSLKALQYLLNHLTESPGFVDPYPTFLTWTIFLYPLSPFFVLFCNIIGELDIDDYNLIQDITQSLSQFTASPYIVKLLKLLDSLQHLCEPLVHAKQHLCPQSSVAPWYPITAGEMLEPITVTDTGPEMGKSYMTPAVELNAQQTQPLGSTSQLHADELMWHLFNSQPSLEWFESDLTSFEPN